MTAAKRSFDLFWSALGLLFLWPLLLGIAVTIRARRDGGPVFFRQRRVGRGGRPLWIWKFRTMVPNAEAMGLQLTAADDPRITPLGALLRRTKLDELPQLFNVIAGEMSLVGPRPEVSRYVELYTPEQRAVLDLTPGITDPASIRYVDEARLLGAAADPHQLYVDDIMPAKIRLNLEYAAGATVMSDFRVILLTLARLAR
jgi:lipopolysaccharide/colanic/teichoic acid biosynthesis glycosyltransferase